MKVRTERKREKKRKRSSDIGGRAGDNSCPLKPWKQVLSQIITFRARAWHVISMNLEIFISIART